MTSPQVLELYAIKYGTLIEQMRRESFVKLDPHDDAPMPIDYYRLGSGLTPANHCHRHRF